MTNLRARVMAILRRNGMPCAKFRRVALGIPDQLLRRGFVVRFPPDQTERVTVTFVTGRDVAANECPTCGDPYGTSPRECNPFGCAIFGRAEACLRRARYAISPDGYQLSLTVGDKIGRASED